MQYSFIAFNAQNEYQNGRKFLKNKIKILSKRLY